MGEIINKIKGFIGKEILGKEKLNDPELEKARIEVCQKQKSCYDKQNNSCKMCHCLVDVKAHFKTGFNPFHLHMEQIHCPLGKWPIRDEEGNIGHNDKEIANHYKRVDGRPLLP